MNDKNQETSKTPDLVDNMKPGNEQSQAVSETESKVETKKTVSSDPQMKPSIKAFFQGLLLSTVVVALDQWSKQIATTNLELYRPEAVFDWLNMMLAHNRGAAFSFLSDAGGWQVWFLSILAAAIAVMVVVWMYRLPRKEKVNMYALALILGGAIGNLADRVRLGYVVDFIDAHLNDVHWPAFNLADSAIFLGVALLIIGMFLYPQKAK